MISRSAKPLRRNLAGLLCGAPVLLACANPPITPEQDGGEKSADGQPPARTGAAPTPEMDEIETLRTMTGAPLTPDQGAKEQHIGKRIRWAGAVHDITTSDKGVCLTILYALSGEYGEPRWTLDPTYQTFDACTAGSYDPDLVHDFTNVTIVGKIAGKTYIEMGGGGSVGPVVEIEHLYRWSDCLAGDTSPACRTGFLTPEPVADD